MMPPGYPTMNQTSSQNGNHFQHANGFSTHTSSSPIPWTEIFSRHESVLSSHLEMLGEVKGHVSDDEALRTVSSMLNKTIQAMNQFKIVRKHMSNKTPENPFKPSTTSQKPSAESTTPHPTQSEPARRKRSRVEQETTGEDYQTVPGNPSTDNPRAPKRVCDIADPQLKYVQNLHNEQPGPNETEDISEEVQRRLRINEERRRKKEKSQVEKRKRDSMLSNESSSPGSTKHRNKRARTGDEGGPGSKMRERVRKVKKMR